MKQKATPPRAEETTIDTENRLVGEYLQEQQTVAGVISVSMSDLDLIRAGIRLALG